MKRTLFILGLSLLNFIGIAQTTTDKDTIDLTPVEVRATRANNLAPFTKLNIGKEEIQRLNLGQDLPFLLYATPGAVASSDAGTGIGYTGLRIRGSDLTRINVTLNGIPYNDAESGGVFFVDLPDFASSVGSIQIQRGAGTSSNGGGAFGATINLSTNETNVKPYADIINGLGSFDTRRHTIKLGTGLLGEHLTFDARLSSIESNGFIDRSASNLQAYYLSGAWTGKKTTVRFNTFSGKEKTYQAWSGIPEHKLNFNRDSLLTHYYNNIGSYYNTPDDSVNLFSADSRKYNVYLYPNQTDNYRQDHYQLFVNQNVSGVSLSTAFYLTRGEGYYEEYKYNQKYKSYGLPDFNAGASTTAATDLVRQLWLKNNLYGGVASIQWKKQNWDYTAGVNWNRFEGQHYGTVAWAMQGIAKDYEWYRFPALKDDGNVYAKFGFKATPKLYFMGDLQYRYVHYRVPGTRKYPDLNVSEHFNFFNPKLGVNYRLKNTSLYLSYAVANKEPNRTDFETSNLNGPKRERLHDFEAGVEHKSGHLNLGATAYYMLYKDQLVLTGKLNDVGDAVRINVPESYRLGLETWAAVELNKWVTVQGNLSISKNKLKLFTDYIPRYDANFGFEGYDTLNLKNPDISFSPWLTAFAGITLKPLKNFEVFINQKGVSKQYLDNTNSGNKKLNGYIVQDMQLRYTLRTETVKAIELIIQVNNIWNKKYETNGYSYSYFYNASLVKENFFYPMAGTNFLVGLNLHL